MKCKQQAVQKKKVARNPFAYLCPTRIGYRKKIIIRGEKKKKKWIPYG